MNKPSGLRPELSLFDATMINAGTIIGSAIFIVPAFVAAGFGAAMPTLLVWVVGGLVSLAGALCVAELGAAMPDAGGQYIYLSRAFHPALGFIYGWSAFFIINTGSLAAIAVGFATYLRYFGPFSHLTDFDVQLVAAGSIVVLTLINGLGVRAGALTQNVLTVLKLGALVAIPVFALALPGGTPANLTPHWPGGGVRSILAAAGPALVVVLWAYDGWIESTYVGSEIKNPGRNLPLSIILSTLIVVGVYVSVNAAYVYLLSPARMAGSERVAADAMQVVLGTGGATFIVLAILVSTLGCNNGIVFTSARIPYAMAHEGRFFAWAGRLNRRFNSPNITLFVQMVVAVALTLTGSYVQLGTYVVFVSFLFYGMSAAAVMVLRLRQPDLPRPYRTWGYPVTPIVFILFALYLVGDTIYHTPRDSAVGAGIVMLGLPAYAYWRKQETGKRK